MTSLTSCAAARLPQRGSGSISHQLRFQRRSQRNSLRLQRSADLLVHRLNRERPTEASARRAFAPKSLLTGQMGRTHQRYLPGLLARRLRLLILPLGSGYRRTNLGVRLQLGHHHLLGDMRLGWSLVHGGRWKDIRRASVSCQGRLNSLRSWAELKGLTSSGLCDIYG